jgi:ATP-dependent DNA helicase RecQ
MRVSEWLSKDPVSFDIARKKSALKINKEVFELLASKLRGDHPDYFCYALGLKTRIEFKGYNSPVQAIVPYSNKPAEFYKWWCTNQDSVNMTFGEKLKLFDKVLAERPAVLKREHKQLINKHNRT